MEIVYVATEEGIEYTHILGIFIDEGAAIERAREQQKRSEGWNEDYYVYAWPIGFRRHISFVKI